MGGSFPLELVLHVITCSLPDSTSALLDAAHPTTRLLLTFTLVCHETRRLANRYLRQHCVFLNSEKRLVSFLGAIPEQPMLRNITSLLLSPFKVNIDDLPLCCLIRDLLSFTCDTLRKLVIDMPLRTCYPEDDHRAVRPVLRDAFERLVNLEEFVSVQDELFLDVYQYECAFVWKTWPKLKKLALWNVAADPDFWRQVALHPTLSALILINADDLMDIDPKGEYFKYTNRPLRVLICQRRFGFRGTPDYLSPHWQRQGQEQEMNIYKYRLPDLINIYNSRLHQVYVKRAAENGTLWDWEGEEVIHPTQLNNIDDIFRLD
ncbi:hypothetical protein GQ44DRAFT_708238 [Phaeosphaeriaceae sp. PMI808]|nr:hypothetical protein GQ44DRAFT_708238 [Phaeosphaeriaceae sp. PMI808]